jgi:hypothetical protein
LFGTDTFGATDSGEYRAKLSTPLAPIVTWLTEALQHHPEP